MIATVSLRLEVLLSSKKNQCFLRAIFERDNCESTIKWILGDATAVEILMCVEFVCKIKSILLEDAAKSWEPALVVLFGRQGKKNTSVPGREATNLAGDMDSFE